VKKALTGIGALFVAACGPDFSDNGAIRCEQSVECGPEAACYRGFCVADPNSLAPIEVDADGGLLSTADSGTDLAPSTTDAGAVLPMQLVEGAGTPGDAGTAGSVPDAAMSVSPAPPLATPTPVEPVPTTPVPTTPVPTTPTPTPTTPTTGVPADSSCTLKECCAEAKKAYEERKQHEDDPKYTPKKGKCGCSGPDLLNTLTCGLGSITGLT